MGFMVLMSTVCLDIYARRAHSIRMATTHIVRKIFLDIYELGPRVCEIVNLRMHHADTLLVLCVVQAKYVRLDFCVATII